MGYQKHHNIFDYYRGKANGDDASKEIALENNVTKALINVLELSDPESKISEDFIKWLADKASCGFRPRIISNYLLQTRPDRNEYYVSRERTKLLLGIVPYGWEQNHIPGKKRPTTRPDAWLIGRNFTILIESKCRGGLDKAQVEKHRELLYPHHEKKLRPVEVNWKDIHNRFRKLQKQETCTEKSNFLIDQFCEFLNSHGLAGFRGFKQEHFDFPKKKGEKQEKIRQELRAALRALTSELHGHRYEDDVRLFDWYPASTKPLGLHGLTKDKSFAQVYFYRGPYDTQKQIEENEAHQCVQLDFNEEKLWVWARVKTEPMLTRLYQRIEKKKDELLRILREMPPDHEYKIDLYDDNRSYLDRRQEIEVREVVNDLEWLDRICESLKANCSVRNLEFAISRCLSKDRVINEGSKLVDTIAETMKAIDPFVEFVNTRRI